MPSPFSKQQLIRFCQKNKIEEVNFLTAFETTWKPLILEINRQFQKRGKRPLIVGINAPQGAGKSTLCELMKCVLIQQFSRNVVTFSLDDFYKTRLERTVISKSLHPLFLTRGVPGTHDVSLALETLTKLRYSGDFQCSIPQFDKALDDRKNPDDWLLVKTPVDIILFEGWCLGIPPQDSALLQKPINKLENTLDAEGIWRREVNRTLTQAYQSLFSQIDYLVYISAPSFSCVVKWRREQEEKLKKKLQLQTQPTNFVMHEAKLSEFMMHFERLTRHGFNELPKIADHIINLDEHRIPKLSNR